MSALYGVLLMLTAGFYTTSSFAAEPSPSTRSATPESTTTAVLNGQRALPTNRNILAANTTQARGVVILLPGVEESFDWPITIGPLRRKLPDAGWHTLSLNLPTAPATQLPAEQATAGLVAEQIIVYAPLPEEPDAPSADEPEPLEAEPEVDDEAEEEPADESSNAEPPAAAFATIAPPTKPKPMPIPDYPQRISNFIDAAVAHAQTLNPAEIILLGHHEGAHWALGYATKNAVRITTPMRIGLIAPRNSNLLQVSYENLIEANTQHLADFYYKNHAAEHKAAQQRLYASRRANLQHYHQVALSTASGVQVIEQERLFRRVKGWLNKP